MYRIYLKIPFNDNLKKFVLIFKRELQLGIRKFRDLLLKNNIQSISSIRQILLKKFAECLMFNIPAYKYSPLQLSKNDDKQKYDCYVFCLFCLFSYRKCLSIGLQTEFIFFD